MFPIALIKAKVIPLFKDGDRLKPENYTHTYKFTYTHNHLQKTQSYTQILTYTLIYTQTLTHPFNRQYS